MKIGSNINSEMLILFKETMAINWKRGVLRVHYFVVGMVWFFTALFNLRESIENIGIAFLGLLIFTLCYWLLFTIINWVIKGFSEPV